jgi:diguanylate cyclase (GGDEF)-like protein
LRNSIPVEDYRQDHLRREIRVLREKLRKLHDQLTDSLDREKRACYLALHDELTALPNRRFFRERLGSALRNQGAGPACLAVLYLDLDGFKRLNDGYGHATGDRLLSLIAARLAHALRAEDLVSRLSGDEFACLIPGVTSRERLRQIASSLFEAVAAPFKVGTLTLNVRPSIGIAMSPADGTTTDALMEAADAAMYEAKRDQSSFSFADRSAAVPRLNSATSMALQSK